MLGETTAREMIWNPSAQKWSCWNCGHDEFHQRVIAENFVTLTPGDATTLIEADDFEESWDVLERGAITCDNCSAEAEIPAVVGIVEHCQWEGEENAAASFDASFKW